MKYKLAVKSILPELNKYGYLIGSRAINSTYKSNDYDYIMYYKQLPKLIDSIPTEIAKHIKLRFETIKLDSLDYPIDEENLMLFNSLYKLKNELDIFVYYNYRHYLTVKLSTIIGKCFYKNKLITKNRRIAFYRFYNYKINRILRKFI